MAQSLIPCPLCSAASFSNTTALCLSLVNVVSKWLQCTMCGEELKGLDKLTIHLLGHLIHTPDFKALLLNYSPSSDNQWLSTLQPLNLVKAHEELQGENVIHQPLHESIGSQSLQSEKSERPSLKIDDEVMIIFNNSSNDQKTTNSSSHSHNHEISVFKAFDDNVRGLETLSSTGPHKFSTTLDQSNIKQNEDILNMENKGLAIFWDNMKENSSKELLQYPFPYPSINQELLNKNTMDSVTASETQMDVSNDKKQKTIHNSLPNVENISDKKCETSYGITLQDSQSANKSSYLSPKGERVLGYRCDICSLVFPDEHILSMHRQLIHTELDRSPSEPVCYKCHLCSKSFVMKGSLMVHMRVAHFGGAVVARLVEAKQLEKNAVSPDTAQFVCSVCNKGFQKEQQLAQHEKLHEGKQCDVCFKTFTTKYFLRKHKRLHTGEMPYQCSQCNKSFTFQQSYHKHLLYHSDDKPYSCGDCGRAFKELSTLHNHQRIHTGEKPFSCETCGKCFRQRVSYLVHRRIHTGVMPYQCQECGKTFRYKVSERTHKCATSTSQGNNDNVKEALNTPHIDPPLEGAGEKDSRDGVTPSEPPRADQEMFPESTDLLSLVMSPSDRLQNLSLSSNVGSPVSPAQGETIDSETLKQLLYDVADYT